MRYNALRMAWVDVAAGREEVGQDVLVMPVGARGGGDPPGLDQPVLLPIEAALDGPGQDRRPAFLQQHQVINLDVFFFRYLHRERHYLDAPPDAVGGIRDRR